MTRQTYIIDKDGESRLDVFLTEETEKTRSYIKQLNDKGCILLNGEVVKSGKNVRYGDKIEVEFPQEVTSVLPENLPLTILYQDDDVAVLNKAQGMTVHPASGNFTGTVVNALLYHIKNLSAINGVVRPGIVHRLDKNTSGVMIVAKNDAAHLSLSRQIADRKVQKLYRAVVEGIPKLDSGQIETMIARDTKDRKKMAVVTKDGRTAITQYRILKKFQNNAYMEFDLKTGRTHQIRVHAKHLGHPIVGDNVYGFSKQRFALGGQLLHSYSLTVTHPTTNKVMTFVAPLPDYFEKVLQILKNEK